MTRIISKAGVALSLVLVSACGGPQAPKAPDSANTANVAAGGSTLAGGSTAAPDLTPVQAPADLVAYGRLANPGSLIDTTTAWAKLPIDVRAMMQKNEPEVARLLVLDAPVEFAVALDPQGRGDFPQPFAVVSIGMSNVEGTAEFAKQQGASVRMVGPGIYRIEKGRGPSCAVASAIGKAPARLVCGDRPEDIDALLPYATRGLSNENMGNADLHIELRGEPFRTRYSRELRQLKTLATPFVLREMSLDSPRFDRALADAVHGLADEILALADDVDRMAVDAWVKQDSGVIDATVSLKFKGQTSWTVQTMVETAKRAKGVPASFWQLPKDSDLATYGSGANSKRYEPIRRTLGELVDGALEHERIPRKVREQIGELLQEMWNTEGAMAYAHGELPNAQLGADAGMRERVRSQIGWYVAAVDEKPSKYKSYFDKIVKLYNDAQLRNLLDKRMHVKKADLPKLAQRGGRGGLPAGSTIYELTLPAKMFEMDMSPMGGGKAARKAATPLRIFLVLMPDGERTWFGFSTEEKVLTEKLLSAKKGENTLASRSGLSDLKSKTGVSGGFFTIGSFVKGMLSGMAEYRGGGGNPAQVISAMPHHGETPMLMWTSVSSGANPTLSWSLRVPKAIVEDVAAVAPAMAAGGHHGGPAMPLQPAAGPRMMSSPKQKKP